MIPNHTLEPLFRLALSELGLEHEGDLHFEVPVNKEFGDYSTNLAMQLFAKWSADESFKSRFPNPRAVAQGLVDALKIQQGGSDNALIEDISIAGPGFINVTLSTSYLMHQLLTILKNPEALITKTEMGQSAVVEYSSPNIAKPFTIGHLRSIVIGAAVANLLEAKGWDVRRDNHLGDWGTQFGKQIYAIKAWGDEAKIEQADQPVKELVDLYIKFHEEAEKDPTLEDEARAWFKRIEDGDPEARRLWQKCIDWSWKEYNEIYKRLGAVFTENDGRGYGESYFEDKMQPVIEQLRSTATVDYRVGENGAELVFFPNDELPPLMILKKDGTTLYATRDLATDLFRLQTYGPDIHIINEVGAEQALYFRQLFRTEQLLGWYTPEQRVHVKHGLYRFKDKKMSTRKGNVIWLEEVLNEAEERAKQLAQRPKNGGSDSSEAHTLSLSDDDLLANARAIGIGALKWNDLKRSSNLDVVFDWDEILNMQGNSGPYMQYTNVRCLSILKKAELMTESNPPSVEISAIAKYIDTLLYSLNQSEKDVLTTVLQFDFTVTMAAKEYEPHRLCTYLFELAQTYNTFYNTQPILGPDVSPESRAVRLALTAIVQSVLSQGLGMLGIQTVAKM